MNNVHQLCDGYFDTYKSIFGNKKQKTNSTEENLERELEKLLSFEINRGEFEELTNDIYNNQDSNDFKITISKITCDLKNPKKIWTEVTSQKISKSDVKELYRELIQKYTEALEREKSNDIRKCNTLNVLNNLGSIFTGVYFHYKDVPKEIMFQRSITERIKLRKERFNELKRKE